MISVCVSPQHQISTARLEHENNVKEINQHKSTISQKDEDIKTLSLRDKLEEAREGRQGAVRKLEAAQLESKILQSQMTELRQQQAEVKVSH